MDCSENFLENPEAATSSCIESFEEKALFAGVGRRGDKELPVGEDSEKDSESLVLGMLQSGL